VRFWNLLEQPSLRFFWTFHNKSLLYFFFLKRPCYTSWSWICDGSSKHIPRNGPAILVYFNSLCLLSASWIMIMCTLWRSGIIVEIICRPSNKNVNVVLVFVYALCTDFPLFIIQVKGVGRCENIEMRKTMEKEAKFSLYVIAPVHNLYALLSVISAYWMIRLPKLCSFLT